jgi:hypothetical protein
MLASAVTAEADFDLEKAVMKNLKWIRPPTPGTDYKDMMDFFNTNPKEIDNRQIEAAKKAKAMAKQPLDDLVTPPKKDKKDKKQSRKKKDKKKQKKSNRYHEPSIPYGHHHRALTDAELLAYATPVYHSPFAATPLSAYTSQPVHPHEQYFYHHEAARQESPYHHSPLTHHPTLHNNSDSDSDSSSDSSSNSSSSDSHESEKRHKKKKKHHSKRAKKHQRRKIYLDDKEEVHSQSDDTEEHPEVVHHEDEHSYSATEHAVHETHFVPRHHEDYVHEVYHPHGAYGYYDMPVVHQPLHV